MSLQACGNYALEKGVHKNKDKLHPVEIQDSSAFFVFFFLIYFMVNV